MQTTILPNAYTHLMIARLKDGELFLSPIIGWNVKIWYVAGKRKTSISPISIGKGQAIINAVRETWWAGKRSGTGEASLIEYLEGNPI